ncbi:MAG: hypothetical protein DRJ65_11250 [Acidobacteria bacterium]|nr:MAG: hypothetical protein DRJ65_11250 [Acidobacteriota bacterium]
MFINSSKNLLITGLFGILVATGVNAAVSLSIELGTTPSETGAKKIVAAVVSKTGELTDLSTGKAVILPALEATTPVRGGEIFWRSTRNRKDDLGFRHITYQQRFSFSDDLSGLLPAPYSFEGVPLSGGSLKLHYDNKGVLYFVSGAYFEDAQVPVDLSPGTPLAALSNAWQAIGNTDAHEVSDFLSLDLSIKEELLEYTKLKLASTGDGKTFAYIWEAPALLADGRPLMAALDGATGNLLHFWDPNPHWRPTPCGPRSIIGTNARAEPQNGDIAVRTGLAATPSNVTPGYTHEAHWPESSGAPVQIGGYRGTTTDACDWTALTVENYELLPLPTDSQQPFYGGAETQKIGGDAVWKTYLTMEFFDEDARQEGESARRVDLDDGFFVSGNPPAVPHEGPYSYHALDTGAGDFGHFGGMKLAVAFWLAADGEIDDSDYADYEHKNPVCQRATVPPLVDCDLEVTPLGVWPATQIFFQLLTAYAHEDDNWNSFAEYAKRAAYDIFGSTSPCDNAVDEQNTVQDAFTAIGYPGPTPGVRYCVAACCDS